MGRTMHLPYSAWRCQHGATKHGWGPSPFAKFACLLDFPFTCLLFSIGLSLHASGKPLSLVSLAVSRPFTLSIFFSFHRRMAHLLHSGAPSFTTLSFPPMISLLLSFAGCVSFHRPGPPAARATGLQGDCCGTSCSCSRFKHARHAVSKVTFKFIIDMILL
jgi:hypothetical protein